MEEAVVDDKRCKRSDGKRWRCSGQAMDGNVLCEKHYFQAKLRAGRNRNNPNPNPEAAKFQKKRKSNYYVGGLKKIKANVYGGSPHKRVADDHFQFYNSEPVMKKMTKERAEEHGFPWDSERNMLTSHEALKKKRGRLSLKDKNRDWKNYAWEAEEDDEEVWMEREENPMTTFTHKINSSGRNSAERNHVERIQYSLSPLSSSAAGEDEEDERIQYSLSPLSSSAAWEDEEDKHIQYSLSPLSSSAAWEDEEYEEDLNSLVIPDSFKHSDEMQADLDRAIRANKELAKRNNHLTEELCKAKEQFCKKLQDMKTKLGKAELVNRDLDERNKKLEEELNRAKEQGNSSKQNLEQTSNKLQELCRTFSAVKEECDQVCRQQEQTGAAPHLSKKRKYVLKVYEFNDWVNCSICLEPWTESGEHNACSLSCGHFFGRSCITHWISRNGSRGSSTCPVCSNRTTLSDIRCHYVSQIYDGKEKFEQED